MTEPDRDAPRYRLPFAVEIAAALPDPERYGPDDLHRDFRRLFYGSDQGRRALAVILQQTRVFDGLHQETDRLGNARPYDPYAVAHGEGKRAIGLWLMQVIDAEAGT